MNRDHFSIASANVELISEGGPISTVRPVIEGDSVTLSAAPGADIFLDPSGSENPPNAERFVQLVKGDFQFSAFVEVDFKADFDSGVLLGYVNSTTWFKICAELDPDGTQRVVTVVTRDSASDDANSWAISDTGVHLRISRMGDAFALHASHDGAHWNMIRYFSLGHSTPDSIKVGLLAQSPTGRGTSARFSQVFLTSSTLAEVRDGN